MDKMKKKMNDSRGFAIVVLGVLAAAGLVSVGCVVGSDFAVPSPVAGRFFRLCSVKAGRSGHARRWGTEARRHAHQVVAGNTGVTQHQFEDRELLLVNANAVGQEQLAGDSVA
jgi:hypothetical protein